MVDPETGEEVAPGEVGELQLRGGGLMTGFYKVDRDEVFTPDGFYPTKDLVRIDADGYLWFVGRTGDMIKTSSANVSRLEVEAALNALPEVARSLVAGLPDPDLGELVAAAVVPAPGARADRGGPARCAAATACPASRSPAASCSSPTTTSLRHRPARCACSTWRR